MANAIKMLQDDHNSARILFNSIPTIQNGAQDEEEKATMQLISLLQTHTTLEEEMVYPLLADAHPDLIKHSEEEHDEAEQLMKEIAKMPAGMELREAITRLQTAVEEHVNEEEEKLFPLLTETLGVSALEDLGRQMLARQQELMQDADETTGAAATGRPKNIYPKL
jgi:iron-sulfur cluster repair protein YtfE (RIC family)